MTRLSAACALLGFLLAAGPGHAAAPAAGATLNWGAGALPSTAPAARAPAAPGSALRTLPPSPPALVPAPPTTPVGAPPAAPGDGETHQTKAFGPFTGPGFNISCSAGEYVVGFVGHAGAWFDRLTVACAPWIPGKNAVGSFHVLPAVAGTSSGGAPVYSYCNGNDVVHRLAVQMIKQDAGRMLLDNLNFDCVALEAPHTVLESPAIETQEGSEGGFRGASPDGNFSCAPDEFAVGIYGNADEFIHRLGLLCRAAPRRPGYTPAPSARARATPALTAPIIGVRQSTAGAARAAATATPNWGSGGAAAATTLPLPAGGAAPPASPASSGGDPSRPPFDLPNGPTPPLSVHNGLRFNYPYVRAQDQRMTLLDACYNHTGDCGASAAHAYCRSVKGKAATAVDFKTFHGTGRDGRTASLPTLGVCTGSACMGFLYVVCKP